MKMHRLAVVIFISLVYAPALAELRPSFSLEGCSWDATHVVVVTEGEKIDGGLTVLESWKGDLLPGDNITVPELAAFRTKESRLVKDDILSGTPGPAEYVTGLRMILFLKERPKAGREPERAAAARSWEGANRWGGMQVSVLWVEEGQPYAFVQIMNPGDRILVRYGETESKIKERFDEVAATRESLLRALEMKDASARAAALEPFAASELFMARMMAFNGLRGCGRAALPVLRKLLRDQSSSFIHGEVVEVMADVGGYDVAEELTALIGEELAFWRARAPGLKEGWWNNLEEPERELLRDRYSKLHQALLGLQKLKFPGCKTVVTELRDFWRSLPQLEDRSGLNQMSEACDGVLSKLQ